MNVDRMTRCCVVLLLVGFTSQAFPSELRQPVPLTEVTVSQDVEGFATFLGKDLQFHSLSGEPRMPSHVIRLLLPPNAALETVAISLENERLEAVPGAWEVRPMPPLAFWDGTQVVFRFPKDKTIVDGRDRAIYADDAFFPPGFVGRATTGEIREAKVVEVSVATHQWNPVSKHLVRLVEADLVVTFDGGVRGNSGGTLDRIAERVAKRVTINFESVTPAYQKVPARVPSTQVIPSPKSRYVIITTAAIQAGSTQLPGFIHSKQQRGFDVEVITEEVWGGGAGDGAAENIRQWLKAHYMSRNIEYVLLMGDPTPSSGDVPMKMLWPRSNAINIDPLEYVQSPSDFYYADLTGNWDLDGDGFFGESDDDFGTGGVDRNWEVLVGRIPVYGDVGELDRILAKIVTYENTPQSAAEWRKQVLLPMEPSDAFTPGFHLGEAIKDDIVIPKDGWRFHRIYDDDFGLSPPPETVPTTIDTVTQVWRGAPFGAVFWHTHGSSTFAADIMESSRTTELNDEFPAFTFQASCCNAFPDDPANLAFAILNNGGIATIGATRISWYFPGQTDFGGDAGNQSMTYEYARRLITEEMPAGEALYDLKQSIMPFGGELWMNYTDYNVYGDPAVGLFTIASVRVLNEFVSLVPDETTFATVDDTDGCPAGYAGKFLFDATLANQADRILSNLSLEIEELTRQNVLLTREGLLGEGERFEVPQTGDYADGELMPEESVNVSFIVCLTDKHPFRFFVNVLGVASDPLDLDHSVTAVH